jgi:hypothetical protein
MAATVQIHEMSSLTAGEDKTDGTIRFKAADEASVDLTNPVPIPDPGQTSRSYSKTLRPYMAAAPDTQLDNFRWYTDGNNGFGTGISVNVANIGETWSANSDDALAGSSDLFGYSSVSPLDGDSVVTGPFVPEDNLSYIADAIRLQMTVTDAAVPGTKSAEALTLAYDEV